MPMISPTLSRTSSTTSVESDDAGSNASTRSRRTRKRFTSVQLMMLENLFHQTSHPSREQRDGVAKAGAMELKSVTIWFQNKRQMERKGSLNNIPSPIDAAEDVAPVTKPKPKSKPKPYASQLAARPSLDHIASRSERHHAPSTPSRKQNRDASLWDNMPSSPPAPPTSPPEKEYVAFGKLTRRHTLEWACARRRMAEKERGTADDGEETDDATDEAITPPRAWSMTEPRCTKGPGGSIAVRRHAEPDDDMLRAALALCRLGRAA
ncbi:homeodomain transcription factor [Desarmillaria tabescens]|uniref:Homeodomain transcription factor n=1 Tax=Armillaria tabescens TaxID=1929756 RepID=A0AA39NHY0_ARMTA|nr:homeodomain transcription factor [Desarmillaria tabescens]KAK0465967.1 homeodomain transcription factor [Desarmillaria tabescens]